LRKVFIGFILSMERINCWYNTPLQVLTNAPALHSLIIYNRQDAEDILNFFFCKNVDLRKLIVNNCQLGEESTDLLNNIVKFCPDLEVLTLVRCHPIHHDGYCHISHLKKLSELFLGYIEVHYVCVKLLQSFVCIWELMQQNTARNKFYIFSQEENLLQCQFMLHNISFIFHKMEFISLLYLLLFT
jgi:hypothetical protein